MIDKSKLLDRAADAQERMLLARVLDKQQQAEQRNIPVWTDFLSPAQRAAAEEMLRRMGVPRERYTDWGGYDGAERRMLVFLPEWMEAEDAPAQAPVRCLRAEYRPEYHLTHRDLLGSLMGMGVVREKAGDLLVSDTGCDAVVLDSVAEFLLQSWAEAGRARLSVSEIPPENLHIPQVKYQELRDTVAALRLDAVAAAGFRLSRGKAAALVESGKVQVNWRECTKPDRLLSAGDAVTARGFGKLELTEVGGMTKKGRLSIVIKRYI